jgi:nanoRNase/pAp phosphatase (c-di-AMP/oligoRNAs hydrolase)
MVGVVGSSPIAPTNSLKAPLWGLFHSARWVIALIAARYAFLLGTHRAEDYYWPTQIVLRWVFPMSNQKFRLVTRSDFDGLICAVLLNELQLIDDIKFVHPKDMQDGKVEISNQDITTNLPYVAAAHLAFDHHLSETLRNSGDRPNHIIDASAPSAARVVYDYYGGRERFPASFDEMMAAVDKGDAAQFSRDEILHPEGWVLLNFLMDARTGLGRFRNFRISNYALMMDLIRYCRDHTIEQILSLPDVKERVELYREHESLAVAQIERRSRQYKNLVVLDLREEETIYAVNRFMIYALFPAANISIHVMWGVQRQNTVFATGKSILDRSSRTNVGELMLQYGGGGHHAAGTCQVDNDKAVATLEALIARITSDG